MHSKCSVEAAPGRLWRRAQQQPPTSLSALSGGLSSRHPLTMKPGLVARFGIWTRVLVDGQTVVDVMPMIRRDVRGIDAKRLYGINHLQHPFDLRPTGEPQQNLSAGCHIRYGRAALPRHDRAQDVDPRNDRSKIAGGPTDKGKDAAWRERQD